MNLARRRLAFAFAAAALAAPALPATAATIEFAGRTWQVRSNTGGPGPNTFDSANVFVDANGYLHLGIVQRDGVWTCAEVFTDERFGYGTYQFQLLGRPDLLDDNVVLGLFNYTVPGEVGPDGTNEIDIEFATWGGAQVKHGNYGVWPAVPGFAPTSHSFDATLAGDTSTHRFEWGPFYVVFASMDGWHEDLREVYARWSYAPPDYAQRIPQWPIPVHINLWLVNGLAPKDGQPVDVVVTDFKFIENPAFVGGFE